MIWLTVGAALCALPLCATDAFKEPFYCGYEGSVICEQVVRHGGMPITELMRFPLVSKYIFREAEPLFDEFRKQLKEFVTYHYTKDDYVTYSPTGLSATALEKKVGDVRSFQYVYFGEHQDEIKIGAQTVTRWPRSFLFFVGKYACVDFCIDLTDDNTYVNTSSGHCWDPSNKQCYLTRFIVCCNGIYVPTGWFKNTLPGLHKKIMGNEQSFTRKNYVYFHKDDDSTGYERKDFAIDLVKAQVLTQEESRILSKFVPRGKFAKWHDVDDRKLQEKLLNLLFCYGSKEAFLPVVERYVGKIYLHRSLDRWHNYYFSLYDGHIYYQFQKEIPKHWSSGAAYVDATIDYVMNVEKKVKEGIDEKPFTQVLKLWQKKLQFLEKERVSHMPKSKGKYIICYDSLKNEVSIFYNNKKDEFKVISILPVNPGIDINSIKIFDGGKSIVYQSKDS